MSPERLRSVAERPSRATPEEIRWMVEKLFALSGEVRSLRDTYESASMDPLTKTQARLLAYLRDFIRTHGCAPTHGEICREFGWTSLATANEHLTNLEKKGRIRRDFNQQRGIVLLPCPTVAAEVSHGR